MKSTKIILTKENYEKIRKNFLAQISTLLIEGKYDYANTWTNWQNAYTALSKLKDLIKGDVTYSNFSKEFRFVYQQMSLAEKDNHGLTRCRLFDDLKKMLGPYPEVKVIENLEKELEEVKEAEQGKKRFREEDEYEKRKKLKPDDDSTLQKILQKLEKQTELTEEQTKKIDSLQEEQKKQATLLQQSQEKNEELAKKLEAALKLNEELKQQLNKTINPQSFLNGSFFMTDEDTKYKSLVLSYAVDNQNKIDKDIKAKIQDFVNTIRNQESKPQAIESAKEDLRNRLLRCVENQVTIVKAKEAAKTFYRAYAKPAYFAADEESKDLFEELYKAFGKVEKEKNTSKTLADIVDDVVKNKNNSNMPSVLSNDEF